MRLATLAAAALLLYGAVSSTIFTNPIWTGTGLHRFLLFVAAFAVWSASWIAAKPRYWLPATLAAAATWTILATGPAPLLTVIAFALAARALGRRLHPDPALSIALGAAIYMLAIQILVWFPINTRTLYVALIAAPILAGHSALRRDLTALAAVNLSRSTAIAAAPLLFALLCHWLAALKPEVGADALATHLMIPAWIANNASWPFDVERFLLGVMPMGAHWLFTAVYLPCPDPAFAEIAARLLNYAAIVLTCMLIRNASGSTLAAALFASTPFLQLVSGSLFVEPIQTAFTLAAAIAVPHSLLPAAILAGAAMMTKLSALPVVAFLAAYALWIHRHAPRQIALALVAFLAFAAPPYLVAYAQTGNPIFPLANAIFNVPGFRTEALLADSRFTAPLTLTTPYELTFHTSSYYEAWDGSFGLHWLLLPLALFIPTGRRYTLALGAAAALAVLIASPGLRYLLPSLALLALAFGPILRSSRPAAFILALCFAANLYLLPSSSSWHRDFALHWLDPAEHAAYILESAPTRPLIAHLNRHYPRQPALLLETSQLASLAGPVWSNTWYQHAFNARLEKTDTPQQLRELLATHGIKLVIAPDPAAIPQTGLASLIRTQTRPLLQSGPLGLYEITGEPEKPTTPDLLTNGHYQDDHPAIRYSGSWRTQSGFPQSSAGSVTYSNLPGATVTFRFDGTGFRWIFTKAPNRGVARLRIDGGPPQQVNLHAPQPAWQSSYESRALSAGEHMVDIIVVSGFIDIDAVEIVR